MLALAAARTRSSHAVRADCERCDAMRDGYLTDGLGDRPDMRGRADRIIARSISAGISEIRLRTSTGEVSSASQNTTRSPLPTGERTRALESTTEVVSSAEEKTQSFGHPARLKSLSFAYLSFGDST